MPLEYMALKCMMYEAIFIMVLLNGMVGCPLCSNTFHSCEFGLTAELLHSLNNINDPLALLQWHHTVCSILKLEYVVQ